MIKLKIMMILALLITLLAITMTSFALSSNNRTQPAAIFAFRLKNGIRSFLPRDLDLWPCDSEISVFPGIIYVKFSNASYIGFWNIMRYHINA